ncbi:MAG: FAD-dependent oxidoreductase [Pseudomonadales bacterium]|nr:FAD-dependent oxidoreductase [Pseudomonadales bacterium]
MNLVKTCTQVALHFARHTSLAFSLHRLLIVASLFSLTACVSDTPPDVEAPKITIVGAGVSGLATAKRLTEAGFDVTVLEARDRIGGRTWSYQSNTGATLDLGASWIHGDFAPFEDLAKQQGIELVNTDFENLLIHNSEGQSQHLSEVDTESLINAMQIGVGLANLMGGSASMQDVIDKSWPLLALAGFSRELVDFLVTADIEVSSAASAEDLTVRSYLGDIFAMIIPSEQDESIDEEEERSKNLAFPKGYNQITDYLAEGLDIQLNTTVLDIDYNQDPIRVTTNQGELSSDLIIVTAPIGVLKAGDISFSPALPDWKQQAIEQTGSGLLNKLFLEFPYSFWDQDPDMLGITQPEKGGLALWVNMEKVTRRPTLMAFSAGRSAKALEALSDQQMVDLAMQRLVQAYGKDIPEPINVTRTRWAADPFAKGSYSYESLNAGVLDSLFLSLPVKARVLFAGEATSIDNGSNVPGAYETGLREAERIIEWYR